MEAAARQLGVSVKTVSRWVGGATEPRLRDLRRIRELFRRHPLPVTYGGAMADVSGNYTIGPGTGRLVVKTGRAGLAAKVGHDLELEFTRWSADITVPGGDDGGLAAATISAELDLGSLTVRAGSGGARPLTDSDRRDIESTIRREDPARLAERPSSVLPGSSRRPPAARSRERSRLTAGPSPSGCRWPIRRPAATRRLVPIVQSAFGIKPYSGFFGALKLRDEVAAEFEVDFTRP